MPCHGIPRSKCMRHGYIDLPVTLEVKSFVHATCFAGWPITTAPGITLWLTTQDAPTKESAPTIMPGKMTELAAITA